MTFHKISHSLAGEIHYWLTKLNRWPRNPCICEGHITFTYLLSKGPSIIKRHLLGGEGRGHPQKEMKGNIGRNPVFSRGDIFFKTPKGLLKVWNNVLFIKKSSRIRIPICKCQFNWKNASTYLPPLKSEKK